MAKDKNLLTDTDIQKVVRKEVSSKSSDGSIWDPRKLAMPVAVIIPLLAGVWWIKGWMSDIDHKLELIGLKVEAAASKRWTKEDMSYWVELLKAFNPDINVPEVDDD